MTSTSARQRVEASDVPDAVWSGLRDNDVLQRHFQGDVDWLRTALAGLATGAADALGPSAAPWLTRAETLARKHFPMAKVRTSPVLPLAFDDRAHAVATRAASGAGPVRRSRLAAGPPGRCRWRW